MHMGTQGKLLCYGPETDDDTNDADVQCPRCDEPAYNNWFDRTVCPEPCGGMHTRCQNCGYAVDLCPFETTPPTAHVYRSTACYHEQHDNCRKVCKFCPSRCTCSCHHTETKEDNA